MPPSFSWKYDSSGVETVGPAGPLPEHRNRRHWWVIELRKKFGRAMSVFSFFGDYKRQRWLLHLKYELSRTKLLGCSGFSFSQPWNLFVPQGFRCWHIKQMALKCVKDSRIRKALFMPMNTRNEENQYTVVNYYSKLCQRHKEPKGRVLLLSWAFWINQQFKVLGFL